MSDFLRPGKSLLGTLVLFLLVGVVVAAGGTAASILISRNETAPAERGNNYSYLSSISYSGKIVAFDSEASNLDLDTTDEYSGWDIFIMNRQLEGGVLDTDIEISMITRGGLADSRYPMLVRKPQPTVGVEYDEQRFVVFQSDSSEFDYLVGGDPGPYRDIFLYDSGGGTPKIYPVSRAYNYPGGLPNNHSGSPGRIANTVDNPVHAGAVVYLVKTDDTYHPWVVFESLATNLVSTANNGKQQIYLRQVKEAYAEPLVGITTLISKNLSGEQANGDCTHPVVSSDGRFVAYVSYATNLVSGPDGTKAQIYLLDQDMGIIYLISSSVGGVSGNGNSFTPSIGETPEGKIRVVFSSDATNLVAGDTNGYRDIFVTEITPGQPGHTILLVSTSSEGVQGNNISTAPTISGNGTVVAFTSYSTNLVYNDNNYECFDTSGRINCPDIFSRTLDYGAYNITWRTSLTQYGEESQANSGATQLDGSGQYASFVTFADLIGDGSMGYYQQIYVRDHGLPAGNPIISPTYWKFINVGLDQSVMQQFTMKFIDELQIGTIAIDGSNPHFAVLVGTCGPGVYHVGDSCTFNVQYNTLQPGDDLGDVFYDKVVINLIDDSREKLYIALEGHISVVSYNPLVMID